MGSKETPLCPTCGLAFQKGRPCFVLAGGDFKRMVVCRACHRRAIPVLVPEAPMTVRVALRPFVRHLRRLAIAYERKSDPRHDGFRQAADILERGEVPELEVEELPTQKPRRHEMAPKPNGVSGPATPAPRSPRSPRSPSGAAASLGRCELAILDVLADAVGPGNVAIVSRTDLAIRAGYSVTSGGFASALTKLRAEMMIGGQSEHLVITEGGKKALELARQHGEEVPHIAPQDVLSYWCERVGTCASTILQRLVGSVTQGLTREQLAHDTGYSPTSGGFASALTELRKLRLVDGLRPSVELLEAMKP